MSNIMAARKAVSSFEAYISSTPTDQMIGPPVSTKQPCLMDFVEAWVRSGEGIRACNGNPQTYMVGLVAIIDEWLRYPRILNYSFVVDPDEDDQVLVRTVSGIFSEPGYTHLAFDQYWFESMAFAYANPRRKGPIYP